MNETACKQCGFDLRWLPARVEPAQPAAGTTSLELFCPACGTLVPVPLSLFGLVPFKHDGLDSFLRIAEPGAAGGSVFNFGELTIDLGTAVRSCSIRDLCFPAVPMLELASDGRSQQAPTTLPDLPIRPEFMALVDWQFTPTRQYSGGPKCSYTFQLYGRPRRENVTIDLLRVQPDKPPGAGNALPGVSLEYWPNLPYRQWSRYYTRLTTTKATRSLLKADRRIAAYWGEASRCVAMQDRGAVQVGEAKERPQWLGLEILAKDAKIAGGAWRIEPAKDPYPTAAAPTLAIDFGTSNTCVACAYTPPGESTEQISIVPKRIGSGGFTDLTARVVAGEPMARRLEAPHYWFPLAGYGPDRNIFPTELAFHAKKDTLHPEVVRAMRPVVDFMIPSPGYEVGFPEHDHLVAEFKWPSESESDPSRAYQRQYIELVLLFVLAHLAKVGLIPRDKRIGLRYSFPLAFSESARSQLHNVFTEVTGEAIAAALAGGGAGGAQDALYVDIGGGSADIALAQLDCDPKDGKTRARWDVITSFRYAGTGFVKQLTESSCISPDCSPSVLRRRIRELGTVEPLISDPEVIPPNQRTPVRSKTWRFYHHLLEYCARLLASRVLTGAYRGEHRNAPRKEHETRLYALGNGWGFGAWAGEEFLERFARDLQERVRAIIAQYAAKDPQALPEVLRSEHPYSAPVSVLYEPLRTKPGPLQPGGQIIPPKEAVARGLLSSLDKVANEKPHGSQASIIGIDFELTDSGFEGAWYQPVGSLISNPPRGATQAKQVGAVQLVNAEGSLAFPRDGFTVPSNKHVIMNHVLLEVGRECLAKGGSKWLSRSPYEVLLESFFLPTLHSES
jgi:hypothetical protein